MAAPGPKTGEKQTIQARHGVATFVPKGHTIKIINTYGKQVVDTWAFALHAPPEDSDIDKGDGGEKDEGEKSKGKKDVTQPGDVAEKAEEATAGAASTLKKTGEEAQETASSAASSAKKATEKPVEKGKEAVEGVADEATKTTEKVSEKIEPGKKGWSSYIPSVRGRNKAPATEPTEGKEAEKSEETEATAKSWSSYLPSWSTGKADGENTNSQKKGWSSYIPSGVGYSSYIPSSSDALSAFASTHNRDPTKSYAEQLYDFSKTPVGAAGISVATGSGYAGSLYAGYKAYSTLASDRNAPGMEFLSMPHTRASTTHLTPRVNDTLVSNLRAPMLTIVEDTSPGIHDTLIAACDPQRYRELGVENWEEHGSCAENLVVALKQLNGMSGLKGSRAIGSDVTVNSVPAPLNLFMNIPWTDGGDISFDSPKGKRGDYIKMRAERDVVVVMSACPQDILEINAKKPMVAHFVVESPSPEEMKKAQEKEEEAKKVVERAQHKQKGTPKKLAQREKEGEQKPAAPARKESTPATPTPKKAAETPKEEESTTPSKTPTKSGRKAPKKLEKRSSASGSPAPAAKS